MQLKYNYSGAPPYGNPIEMATLLYTLYVHALQLGIVTTTAAPAVNRIRCFRLIFWLFCN